MIWTLAKKELRLLLRDPKAAVILLVAPFLFILVLGISLGEGFGQKPDDRLRVVVVDLDQGYTLEEAMAWLAATPGPLVAQTRVAGAVAVERAARAQGRWSDVVKKDLLQTAGIRLEYLQSRAEAKRLVEDGELAAVLVFGPRFSETVARCSFLGNGINPFYRDGIKIRLDPPEQGDGTPAELADETDMLDVELLWDPTQQTAMSMTRQVAQVTLLRVVMPWMIGRAFDKVGDPAFMEMLGKEVPGYQFIPNFLKPALGSGIKKAIQKLFPKYNLTAKTWAALTKSTPRPQSSARATEHREMGGSGFLRRGALRYQLLVPSYTVMFAFFLILTVGWLFTAERRQGTLKRLRAAPISRSEILLGKFLPCLLLSFGQGVFLLLAGKVVFGMSWGPEPLWLLLVVFSTSLAAMGLALLVAAWARTEMQVAIYGMLLALLLAGLSGCLMGDRSLMPEQMQEISRVTPHAWALDAYRQLLTNPSPNYKIVARACAVLAGFGVGFILLAWLGLWRQE
jgi:ABC-type Na+ efflux pump permease subunit